MTLPNRPRYATRLNAFRQKGDSVAEMIAAAGRVGGLDAADLNYPTTMARLNCRGFWLITAWR
jgi:hypothetical protein